MAGFIDGARNYFKFMFSTQEKSSNNTTQDAPSEQGSKEIAAPTPISKSKSVAPVLPTQDLKKSISSSPETRSKGPSTEKSTMEEKAPAPEAQQSPDAPSAPESLRNESGFLTATARDQAQRDIAAAEQRAAFLASLGPTPQGSALISPLKDAAVLSVDNQSELHQLIQSSKPYSEPPKELYNLSAEQGPQVTIEATALSLLQASQTIEKAEKEAEIREGSSYTYQIFADPYVVLNVATTQNTAMLTINSVPQEIALPQPEEEEKNATENKFIAAPNGEFNGPGFKFVTSVGGFIITPATDEFALLRKVSPVYFRASDASIIASVRSLDSGNIQPAIAKDYATDPIAPVTSGPPLGYQLIVSRDGGWKMQFSGFKGTACYRYRFLHTDGVTESEESPDFCFTYTPVVLDMNNSGKLELISVNDSKVTINTLDNTQKAYTMGWVGPEDGLLVYDYDNDNRVTHVNEVSFVSYLQGAKTDLEGLRAFDTNKNNKLDSEDEAFALFKVWQDKNSDGIVDPHEMKTLTEHGITAIVLKSDEIVSIESDNIIFGNTTYETQDGQSHLVGDVGFIVSLETPPSEREKIVPKESTPEIIRELYPEVLRDLQPVENAF